MDGFGNASGNSIGDNSTAVGAANSDSDLNAILDGVPDLLRGERIVLVDAGGRTSDVSKGVIGSDRVQLGTTDIDVFRINDGAEALQGKFPDFPATAGQWRAAVAANMDRLDLLGEANGEAFIRDVKRRNNEVPDFMRSGEPEDGYANVSADGFQYDASQPRQALSGFDLNRRWQTLDQIFVGAQEYYAEQGALAGQENRPIGFVGNGIGFALTGVGSVLTPRTGFEATMAVVAGPYVEAALPMVTSVVGVVGRRVFSYEADGFLGNGIVANSAGQLGLRKLDPTTMSFTQASVDEAKLGRLVQSMEKNGWSGKPVDAVLQADGTVLSVDNTRVLAARITGTEAHVNVRAVNEAITDPVRRAQLSYNGVTPKTWGDAAQLRILRQEDFSPGWSVRFPNGSIYDPVAK
jgi:hypothetical protein